MNANSVQVWKVCHKSSSNFPNPYARLPVTPEQTIRVSRRWRSSRLSAFLLKQQGNPPPPMLKAWPIWWLPSHTAHLTDTLCLLLLPAEINQTLEWVSRAKLTFPSRIASTVVPLRPVKASSLLVRKMDY